MQQNTHIFSSVHETFSRIDHILGHKTSLNKFKNIEITSSIFSDDNGMKLQINYKKKTGKITDMCRMNNILLNNYWGNEEIKGEIKNYLKTNENENTTYQNLWDAAKAGREVYGNTGLPQETRKPSSTRNQSPGSRTKCWPGPGAGPPQTHRTLKELLLPGESLELRCPILVLPGQL